MARVGVETPLLSCSLIIQRLSDDLSCDRLSLNYLEMMTILSTLDRRARARPPAWGSWPHQKSASMSAMTNFLRGLFPGCSHRSTTFPLTPIRNARGLFASCPMGSRTYVVCLECGKEFPYNWSEMRITKSSIR